MHRLADGRTVEGSTKSAARLADGADPPTVRNITTTTQINASKKSTTRDTDIKELAISVESFNCHGYKQSFDYILSRLVQTDFM